MPSSQSLGRLGTIFFPWLLIITFGLSGCGQAGRMGMTSGKDQSGPAAPRPQSEFDFYCSLRPAPSETGSLAGPRPFAPAVYDAMKARGYKVYLVQYRFRRQDNGFGGFGGFGFRDFFGIGDAGSGAGRVVAGQRVAVVWETRRGEYFLVDRYYATPLWLDGSTWLEKVRFYDFAAVSVEVIKS